MIKNLTPHDVNIVKGGKVIKTFKPEGLVRCTQSTKVIGEVEGINITSTVFGDVEGLPAEVEGTYYIVSRLVLNACKSRNDLLVPNELVRDDKGNIIGCQSLANN